MKWVIIRNVADYSSSSYIADSFPRIYNRKEKKME